MAALPPVGSPDLDDPTGELEKVVNVAFDRLEGIVENVIPEVVNRPFGSQKVPREQRLLEYNSTVRGNVQGYQQKLQGYVAQEGELRGLQLFIEDIEDLEQG